MPDSTGPVLLVVGGDAKRLQWLNHHVTSHWPSAQVTTVPAPDSGSLSRFVEERAPDAVILQIDFGNDDLTSTGLEHLGQMLRARPNTYCIILAERGNELSAVRALKCGAKDYLPLARITRDALLKAVGDACAKPASTEMAAGDAILAPAADAPSIRVPGYSIVKEIATSNFSSVFLARSTRLRRNVVLKVMSRGSSPRELDDAERFQREYEIISSIAHRAIAEIYDFGALPQHQYLALEYIPCGDLRDRLRNPMSIDESLYYLRAIAEASGSPGARSTKRAPPVRAKYSARPTTSARSKRRGSASTHAPTSTAWESCSTKCSPDSAPTAARAPWTSWNSTPTHPCPGCPITWPCSRRWSIG
jgi:DNA-binding NarL/FixJ family response regulator